MTILVTGTSISTASGNTGKLRAIKGTSYYLTLDLQDLPENQLRQNLRLLFKSDDLGKVTKCDEGYVQAVGVFDGAFRTNLTGDSFFTSLIRCEFCEFDGSY